LDCGATRQLGYADCKAAQPRRVWRFVSDRSGMRVKVEFGADRFSVMATTQWGFGASFSHRQTHPREGPVES
jgi:hypothetical protein